MHGLRRIDGRIKGQADPVQGNGSRRRLVAVNGADHQHAQVGVKRLDVAHPQRLRLDGSTGRRLQFGGFAHGHPDVRQPGRKLGAGVGGLGAGRYKTGSSADSNENMGGKKRGHDRQFNEAG